ncbi:hypothetical protein DPV78_004665 [Talaromyces pinophilus]|nr:hypothetical protein DPV78_004665 [Talaromyces pinophilus]
MSRLNSTSSQSPPIMSVNEYKYDWIDGAESLEKYQPGGYHPVMIGDMLHQRYRIMDKLGFGGYSTIWLGLDTQSRQYVAIKICIADAHPSETSVLKALSSPSSSSHSGQKSIPLPLDEFQVHGPNGTHNYYTMTPARCNLRQVSFSHLFPLEVARALSGGLAMAVTYTHSRGFDQFSIEELYEEYGEPETVAISESSKRPLQANIPAKAVLPLYLGKDAEEFSLSDAQVLLSDFGEAFSPGHTERLGQDCHTPLVMQPPEARFAPQSPLSYSADIWSLAFVIWEIIGMKAIFSSEFATADDIFAQQIDVIGTSSLPSEWWEAWEQRIPKEGRYVWPSFEQAFEEGVQKYRRRSQKVKEFDEEEMPAILTLMRRMLVFRPEHRLTAEEILQSEWMVKWALPEFHKTLEMV